MDKNKQTIIKVVIIILLAWVIGTIIFVFVFLRDQTKTSPSVYIDPYNLQCPKGSFAKGIVGTHNKKLITKFGLQCEKEDISSVDSASSVGTVFIGNGDGYGHFSFGPDLCVGKLTGVNIYPKTGQITRITKICNKGIGRDSAKNARILECAFGIKGINIELDAKGFIFNVKKLLCE